MATEDLLAVRLQLLKRQLAELQLAAASFAPAMHIHVMADIIGLPAALAAKADATAITALIDDIDALTAALAAKADTAALPETIDDRVATLLTEGANVTLTYDDVTGSLTIAAAGSSGPVIIENRTDDPASPATGQLWLRTDL